LTFFLLDMNRYGFVNWLPDFLAESGESIGIGGFGFKEVMKRIIHPLAGSVGAIAAGWATDRFFKGRRAPVIALLLALLGALSIVFPYLDPSNAGLVIFMIAAIGFCTYGPHILMVGHAAQDFGKKSGAAGAAGFIDGMGYIGASLAGWGAGVMITRYGYEFTFIFFGAAAIIGALSVCLIWKAGPRTHVVD
jgi:OPA family glycerol-3-phosphate transporter-like MFS transporter